MKSKAIRNILSLLAILSTPALAACGGGGDGGNPYEDVAEGNAQAVREQCSKFHECRATYPAAPEMFEFFFGTSADACIEAGLPDPAYDQAMREAVDAGRVIYDPEAAEACVEMFIAPTCDTFWNTDFPDVCLTVIRGTIADGGACTIADECVNRSCVNSVCQI